MYGCRLNAERSVLIESVSDVGPEETEVVNAVNELNDVYHGTAIKKKMWMNRIIYIVSRIRSENSFCIAFDIFNKINIYFMSKKSNFLLCDALFYFGSNPSVCPLNMYFTGKDMT